LIEGNPGKRRINNAEWRPNDETPVPDAPDYLGDVAAAEWRRVAPELSAMGCLHPTVDLSVLAAYCQAFDRWRKAEEVMARDKTGGAGMVQRTHNGVFVHSPMVSIANKAMRDMVAYMGELGMTPVARARIGAANHGEGQTELESLLAK